MNLKYDRLNLKEPIVKLIKAFETPFKNTIATARTCYSSKGIVSDEQIVDTLDPMSRDMKIARSIFEAGHHTTFQHAHFQFTIENVSRQFVWSFLHSHPFYNSEQVSQRYVEVKSENFTIPPISGEALEIYVRTINEQIKSYKQLIELLQPVTANEYFKIFPGRKATSNKYEKDVRRKAQEIARYVLPIAVHTYLYHTINAITLLRYHRTCEQYDVPFEQKVVVSRMIDELLKVDPGYKLVIEKIPPLEETIEYDFLSKKLSDDLSLRKKFLNDFDQSIDGKTSKLIDYKVNNEKILADAIREVLGATVDELPDETAIDNLLNPKKNKFLADTFVITMHSKLMRTMYHPVYTFRKKLSHTADSQDQRHRTTPASRPVLHTHLTDIPDYIVPGLIGISSEAYKLYEETMYKTWESINRLRKMGVKNEYIIYLLPNAFPIRFTESADLLNLHHKLVMRLCYNAQEEIWRASLEEAQQVFEVNPVIGKHLLPPCTLRAEAGWYPICPEGERYCGVKVWKLDKSEFSRII